MSLRVWKRHDLSRGGLKESTGEIQPRRPAGRLDFAPPRASGDLIFTAESGPTAPPVCAVHLQIVSSCFGAAGLLIPTHDQERQLNLTDAEDHITCSYVTVRLFMSYPSLPTRGFMLITPEDVQGGGLFQKKAAGLYYTKPL